MPVLRLLLLLVVLGGLTLLLLQNWSPVLPLVFLGGRSQALPLAVWILLSIAAGALSALLIAGLFKTSNYFAQSRVKRRSIGDRTPPRPNQRTVKQEYTTAASATYSSAASTTTDPTDDWNSDNSTDEDWNFEENPTPGNFPPETTINNSKTYEVSPDSSRTNSSSSVYSYSSSEPRNTSVGKTESVYDADYRVITPPYGSRNPTEDDEDWGFEDDEFDDEDDNNSRLR
ncbi:LapA family protein [Gloeocapsa sp. BRSZ]